MNIAKWLRILAVTALVATGCASGNPSATASRPRLQSSCPAAQQAPQFPASAPSKPNLVLGKLLGSDRTVVRDITDITHPRTIITSAIGSTIPRFVSGTVVSYVDQSGYLTRLDLSGPSTTAVAPCVGLYDWSPDGTTAVYLTQSASALALHQVKAGQDRILDSMPAVPAKGCGSQTCADRFDYRLSFSPDGAFISLVENWGGPGFRLWSSDGTLIKSIDATSLAGADPPTMSAWSGKNLYFRDANGVEVWRDGVISSFLPGVKWIRPKASPGGSQIVYAARDSAGWAHTYLVETSSGKVRDLGKGRVEPAFLTPSWIWYKGERSCVAADSCDPSIPVIASGTTYIYDQQDSTEAESRITSVADVWPHPA
jgi:hypothetical protein